MNRFTQLFPLWALLVTGMACLFAAPLTRLQSLIVPLLALVMFCMGLTLSQADFRRVLANPLPVALGVTLQFLLMPLIAWTIAIGLGLSAQLTAGMILVGSCSGGTASNVICYLARGDVALSISMTLVSTLLGIIATPLLCTLYLSRTVDVDTLGMFVNILQVVLLPVAIGTLVRHFWSAGINRIEFLLPGLAVAVILLIIAIIVALNAERLAEIGAITCLAVILHNSGGLAGGYYLSRLMGMDKLRARTIAIEVGMQNSGLGVTLALQFFSATAALPGALFSVWHNISGSLLASWWSRRKISQIQGTSVD